VVRGGDIGGVGAEGERNGGVPEGDEHTRLSASGQAQRPPVRVRPLLRHACHAPSLQPPPADGADRTAGNSAARFSLRLGCGVGARRDGGAPTRVPPPFPGGSVTAATRAGQQSRPGPSSIDTT
jgi:hypothetical protein